MPGPLRGCVVNRRLICAPGTERATIPYPNRKRAVVARCDASSSAEVVPDAAPVAVPNSNAPSAPQATPKPVRTPGVRQHDGRANGTYIEMVALCTTEEELCKVARARQVGRSSTELGAVLHTLKQVRSGSSYIRDKFADAQSVKADTRLLQKELLAECKDTVERMPARSIANMLFDITIMGFADKQLFLSAAIAINNRVEGDPKAFKAVELAQIARACRNMRFENKFSRRALIKNGIALDVAEWNPTSAANLLHDCVKAAEMHDVNYDRLITVLIAYLSQHSVLFDSQHCRTIVEALWNNRSPQATDLLDRVQTTICRQPPNRMGSLTAARLLRKFAMRGSINAETAQFLITRIQKEKQFGVPVQSVLQDAKPFLDKLGYQVNQDSKSSILMYKFGR